jgi:hypothetical protein
MFERGTLRTLASAEALIKLIQNNKMTEFDEKMAKLDIVSIWPCPEPKPELTNILPGFCTPRLVLDKSLRDFVKSGFAPRLVLDKSPRDFAPRGWCWTKRP